MSLLLLLILLCVHHVQASYIAYNTSSGPLPHKLNLHLVPHTHDDVGWLKTPDQYYIGANNSIQTAAVQLILDTVINALEEDPNRRFMYVEQAFFQRWWREQSSTKQEAVKKLVESGQLELVNGGWCMHDEATTLYIDMIDQTTLGHWFIKRQFGKSPQIGWQIDPFGHSAVQAYLLSAELGFDALYFGRIDYQDKSNRKNDTTLQFVWEGSRSVGSSAQIFTGVFLEWYGPPDGFEFETGDKSIPVQDDPLLFDYNVKERVDLFVQTAQQQALYSRTNNIMFTMGEDFTYSNARSWYREMDKFIHYVNLDGRINTFYSTPSLFTKSIYSSNISWPLKTGDFFPYADDANSYWTGYFTSRPAFKAYVRMLSGYYLGARQLEFLVGRKTSGPTTDSLGEALATAQHHDAVSGTEKQHVANDYAKRLAIGADEAAEVINSAFTFLTSSLKPGAPHKAFQQCQLLNVSYCPPSESGISSNKTLVVIIYNSVGWRRTDYVRIPVTANALIVRDSDGKIVPAQLVPLNNVTERVRRFYVQANLGVSPGNTSPFWLVFKVSAPPLGFSTYFISAPTTGRLVQNNLQEKVSEASSVETPSSQGNVVAGSGNLMLTFSVETGLLKEMSNKRTGVDIPVQQSFSWYASYSGSEGDQASGAYIFRPNGTLSIGSAEKVPLTVLRGPLLDEVHQHFSPWIYQVTRVYKDKEYAESEFTIGPVPIDDGIGKEVITRITTNVVNNGTFYTDSNGRDFLRRIRNYRSDWKLQVNQPIAGNYYPLNLGMYIKDDKNELSVLVDRPVGGSSISDGELEIMLHRRLLNDDGRGVGESLNETTCVGDNCEGLTIQGRYFTSINPINEGSRWRRLTGQQVYSPFLLAFTTQVEGEDWRSSYVPTFHAMAKDYSLPENVALITLQELDDNSVLLRLAHLFEIDEDVELSSMASVDLKMLFPGRKIVSATELSLSANQEKSVMIERRLQWKVEGGKNNKGGAAKKGEAFDEKRLVVELGPMEIRTFSLTFD